MGRRALLLTLFAAAACTSSSDETSRTGRVAEAVYAGEVDDTDRFAVGVCHGVAGNCDGTCSGALILPNLVATARHCVDEAPENVDCLTPEGGAVSFGPRQVGSLFVTTNTQLDSDPDGPGWYAVKSVHTPTSTTFCGNDIALLVLATSVPVTDAKPVTPAVRFPMFDPQYAAAFSGIGFGQTAPAGFPGPSGTRHRLDGIKVVCIPDSPNLPCLQHNPMEFAGGNGLCSGDSGSNAFEKSSMERGEPVTFGVLSRAGSDCAGSSYTRFDVHRQFVIDTAKLASESYTLYPEPPWTAPRPEPVPDAGGVDGPGARDAGCVDPDGGSGCRKAAAGASPTDAGGGCGCTIAGRDEPEWPKLSIFSVFFMLFARRWRRRAAR